MKFTEITVTTTREGQELVADVLWNFTNYGVAISDANDVAELIRDRRSTFDYIDDDLLKDLNSDVVLVKAYIAVDVTEETLPEIRAGFDSLVRNSAGEINFGTLETVRRTVDGDDWIEIWRKHYRPITFGKVVVCPAWIDCEIEKDQVKVLIGSNMAFGTGEHETTSMVVSLMQNYVGKDSFVIDVGTGSGILGIAAAKLGAKRVVMTDKDYVAVKSANDNCRLNGVEDVCEVSLGNLLDDKSVKGDLLLANITADVLLVLSETVTENVKQSGVMIMSGIIKKKEDEVLKRYSSLGFVLEERREAGEWIALAMRRV